MIHYFKISIFLLLWLPLQLMSQHVGINIDTPAVELDIRSLDINQASQFNLGNLDNTHLLRLFSGSPSEPYTIIFWNEGDPLILGNGTAGIEFFERMHIAADGRIGIGVNPDSSAQFQIESTSKGVIFPRMTTMERDAIINPANGLHIFNIESQCLEYYDDYIEDWNCYCLECRTKVITITDDVCGVDFFTAYANSFSVPQKYFIMIPDSVIVSACFAGEDAIDFSGLPAGSQVKIKNHGLVIGGGGLGGLGGGKSYCFGSNNSYPQPGSNGGNAIVASTGVSIVVENYGMIAGGGGGGGAGGGTGTCNIYIGGGGGGGAGNPQGSGGNQLGSDLAIYDWCSCFFYTSEGGSSGSLINEINSPNYGGVGGNGVIFTGDCDNDGSEVGAVGGDGGTLGNPGNGGSQCSSNETSGGAPGKAISGGSGNTIINVDGGVIYGVVD